MRKYKPVLKEAEHSSKSNPKLVQQALKKAKQDSNSWMEDMINNMNPNSLSPSDIDTLQDFLRNNESFMPIKRGRER